MSSANWERLEVNGKTVIRYKNQTDFVELTRLDGQYLEDIREPFALVLPKCKTIPENFINHSLELEHIKFQEGLEEIGLSAFEGCERLKKVVLPNSVRKIGRSAFSNCKSIKIAQLNEGLIELGNYAFSMCDLLEEITVPQSVEKISPGCFSGCSNLQSFNVAEHLFNQLYGQNSLSLIRLNKLVIDGERFNGQKFNSVIDEVLVAMLQQFSVRELSQINMAGIKAVNKKVFNTFQDEMSQDAYDIMQYLSYMLGVLSPDAKLSQQASSLITTAIDGKPMRDETGKVVKDENGETVMVKLDPFMFMSSLEGIFENTGLKMNPEMVNFYLSHGGKNFFRLLSEMENNPSLFQAIFDNYDEAVRLNVSNNAQARQLVPTIDYFLQYLENLKNSKFSGVTPETEPIARELSKFTFYKQEDFELACNIYREYLAMVEEEKRKDPSYEDVPITYETAQKKLALSALDNMDLMSSQIQENLIETANLVGQTIDQEETWEWLAHSDPMNFTLGHYCGCCAKIQGAGEGIALASVKLPNVRNLVIKNKKGIPVAKSTIYVNVAKGYALLNNVEVKNSATSEEKERIFAKLQEAIQAFIVQYNIDAQAKGLPLLTQVNMGMHLNDLSEQIKNNYEQGEILEGINFGDYGVNGHYNGDWKSEQRVMWSAKEETAEQGLTIER